MNREDIIRMAREAGFSDSNGVVHAAYQLESFAALVASAERERLTDSAMKSAEKAVEVAMALEREACAKLLEQAAEAAKNADPQGFVWQAVKASAEVIRARGESK